MKKVTLGPQTLNYPLPAFLIGAKVNGKPNFMTVAWCSIANSDPPMISVAIRHQHYTCEGIKQNGNFSVNLPSISLVKETDYCGIVSGAKEDKAAICGFKVFYGKLQAVPLIDQCPVNLECKVIHELNLGSHALFIAQIEETHVSHTRSNPSFTIVQGKKLIMP
jgi:flavin reductase (DIM6/NTAB) family NADH-FMN oxidoreductase RutF